MRFDDLAAAGSGTQERGTVTTHQYTDTVAESCAEFRTWLASRSARALRREEIWLRCLPLLVVGGILLGMVAIAEVVLRWRG